MAVYTKNYREKGWRGAKFWTPFMSQNIHLRIYELTQKLNELLTSNRITELPEVLKERSTLIDSLKEIQPPEPELSRKIVELENKNYQLLKKAIQEQEQAIKELEIMKSAVAKYSHSIKMGKLLDIEDI